jgi:hypothetical protein
MLRREEPREEGLAQPSMMLNVLVREAYLFSPMAAGSFVDLGEGSMFSSLRESISPR